MVVKGSPVATCGDGSDCGFVVLDVDDILAVTLMCDVSNARILWESKKDLRVSARRNNDRFGVTYAQSTMRGSRKRILSTEGK